MAIALRPCAMCGGAVELVKIAKVAGEADPPTLTAHGMPALKCAKGHARPVHPDFLLWLLGEVRERQGGLHAGEGKGLVFKKYFCECGKEQLRSLSEVRKLLSLAMVGICDRAGFPHSG